MAEDESLKRLQSQMSNEERVRRANVVLCTLWHPDVTQRQVRHSIYCNVWNLCFTAAAGKSIYEVLICISPDGLFVVSITTAEQHTQLTRRVQTSNCDELMV